MYFFIFKQNPDRHPYSQKDKIRFEDFKQLGQNNLVARGRVGLRTSRVEVKILIS